MEVITLKYAAFVWRFGVTPKTGLIVMVDGFPMSLTVIGDEVIMTPE